MPGDAKPSRNSGDPGGRLHRAVHRAGAGRRRLGAGPSRDVHPGERCGARGAGQLLPRARPHRRAAAGRSAVHSGAPPRRLAPRLRRDARLGDRGVRHGHRRGEAGRYGPADAARARRRERLLREPALRPRRHGHLRPPPRRGHPGRRLRRQRGHHRAGRPGDRAAPDRRAGRRRPGHLAQRRAPGVREAARLAAGDALDRVAPGRRGRAPLLPRERDVLLGHDPALLAVGRPGPVLRGGPGPGRRSRPPSTTPRSPCAGARLTRHGDDGGVQRSLTRGAAAPRRHPLMRAIPRRGRPCAPSRSSPAPPRYPRARCCRSGARSHA